MRIDPTTLIEASKWWELASHPRDSLNAAWRELHLAAQPAAELSRAFAIPESDDSHTAFEWVSGQSITDGYFRSGLIETPRGVVRSALRIFDMTIFLINANGDVYDELVLSPKPEDPPAAAPELVTLEQAFGWVLSTVMNLFDIPIRQATQATPDLPDHPVAKGEPFGAPNQLALIELVRLYSNTASLLDAMSNALEHDYESAGPVLCWPHHFDLARLFVLERDAAGEMTRTLGIGLTPPDSLSESGYWYVSPWSAAAIPTADSMQPKLSHGQWHQRDGQPPMAMLSIETLQGIEDRDVQHRLVADFICEAVARCTAK